MELTDLRNIIKEVMNLSDEEATEINEDTDFALDLGADSLDLAQIIMEVETELNIEIEAEDLEDITTVGDALNKIKSSMN